MKRPYTIVAASRFWLLAAGLSFAITSSIHAAPAFLEDFSSYGDSESVIGDNWRFVKSFPTNSAFVAAAGTHVTVTANGNGDSQNARVASRLFQPLSVSDTANNRLTLDIRWTTPGTSGSRTTTYLNVQQAFGTPAFNMGFFGSNALFFDFGGSGNRLISSGITFDPDAWYRLIAEFTPSSGIVDFRVLKLGEQATEMVWAGSNISEGKALFSPTEWIAIEVDVTRPGSTGSTSSDFDNIAVADTDGSILNPNPTLSNLTVRQTSTAVALEFDAQTGKYYQIGISEDLETWSSDGEGVIGSGTTVHRYYPTEGQDRGFFRVMTN